MSEILEQARSAVRSREFYAAYPEHPKAYGDEGNAKAQEWLAARLNKPFDELLQNAGSEAVGEEVSPYTGEALGITYPSTPPEKLIENAQAAWDAWLYADAATRAAVLIDSLERIRQRFFDIAHATMHTSGQSYMMAFQASGPHANDRALETIVLGVEELERFPRVAQWTKPMGKFDLQIAKSWRPIGKGIGMVVGCSTFPIWNSMPGIYATLITGSPVIIKPHPGAILPIAIVAAELQQSLVQAGFSADLAQLAPDTRANPIAKILAENENIRQIDYTGGNTFGNYLESLTSKEVFTEKAGVNCVIIDSSANLEHSLQNVATAACLYSGQMCTAPQNFFIPEEGVKDGDNIVSYEEVVSKLAGHIEAIVSNPKFAAGTLGAVQNEETVRRVAEAKNIPGKVIADSRPIANEEYPNARTISPLVMEVDAGQYEYFSKEWFGPVVLIIKTKNTAHSVELASRLASEKGALSCGAYCTDEAKMEMIAHKMEKAYTPVAFNLSGPIWMNQNAAFSDFHVTGGNPAGNATFTDASYVARRFVWVGHKRG